MAWGLPRGPSGTLGRLQRTGANAFAGEKKVKQCVFIVPLLQTLRARTLEDFSFCIDKHGHRFSARAKVLKAVPCKSAA